MLTVILIIAVLIGMMGGAFIQARNHARRGRAETQLRELVKAWNLYYQTYNQWPSTIGSGNNVQMTATTIAPLLGVVSTDNPQGLPFLSINTQTTAAQFNPTYNDPWGHPYTISFANAAANQEVAMRIAVMFPNFNRAH